MNSRLNYGPSDVILIIAWNIMYRIYTKIICLCGYWPYNYRDNRDEYSKRHGDIKFRNYNCFSKICLVSSKIWILYPYMRDRRSMSFWDLRRFRGNDTSLALLEMKIQGRCHYFGSIIKQRFAFAATLNLTTHAYFQMLNPFNT